MTQSPLINSALSRVDLAKKIANSLMNFPLQPRPEDDPNEYYRLLKRVFTEEITKILNEELS